MFLHLFTLISKNICSSENYHYFTINDQDLNYVEQLFYTEHKRFALKKIEEIFTVIDATKNTDDIIDMTCLNFFKQRNIKTYFQLLKYICYDKSLNSFFDCFDEIIIEHLDIFLAENKISPDTPLKLQTRKNVDLVYNLLLIFKTKYLKDLYEQIKKGQDFDKRNYFVNLHTSINRNKNENFVDLYYKQTLLHEKISFLQDGLENYCVPSDSFCNTTSFNLMIINLLEERKKLSETSNIIFFDIHSDNIFYKHVTLLLNSKKNLDFSVLYDSLLEEQEKIKQVKIDKNTVRFFIQNNLFVFYVKIKREQTIALLNFILSITKNAKDEDLDKLKNILNSIEDHFKQLFTELADTVNIVYQKKQQSIEVKDEENMQVKEQCCSLKTDSQPFYHKLDSFNACSIELLNESSNEKEGENSNINIESIKKFDEKENMTADDKK